MKEFARLISAIAVTTLATAALASDTVNGLDEAGETKGTSAGREGPRGTLVPTWVIPYMRAVADTQRNIASVVTLTNSTTRSCAVQVDYYFAFNADQVPECSLSFTLAPLSPPTPQRTTMTFCNRDSDGAVWSFCPSNCSPELANHEGKTIVSVDPACGTNVKVDAREIITSADQSVMQSIRAMAVHPLGR